MWGEGWDEGKLRFSEQEKNKSYKKLLTNNKNQEIYFFKIN